jgi:DNA-directed RNA polymerase specialized sigma24 family protein
LRRYWLKNKTGVVAVILHINAKLNMWADWVATGRKVVGLGYPSQCAFVRLTPGTGDWRAPIENEEAWLVEQAVHRLDPVLRAAVEQFYLRAGTAETHAKALRCCRDTLYVRIHRAQSQVMDYLQCPEDENFYQKRLTASDTICKKVAG